MNSIFLNLSNHPHEKWDQSQRKAACVHADEIQDFQFPEVSPESSTREIEDLAGEISAQIPEPTTHAMVMGEFTLTFALVREFQKRNVSCLAATNRREIIEESEGKKTALFRFIQFREYPSLV